MKRFLGVSVITASLLVSSVMGATDTPPQIPVSANVKKDTKTNKVKDIEYKINLVKGWNLISLAGYKPYILKDFFGKKELVDKIFVYNSAIQNWQSFVNEGTDPSVQTMVPGMGYWVNAKIPFSISFKSNIPAQRGVYEKAAVNVPKDLTAVADASGEMPPSIPVMVNSAGGYGDAFGDDGKVKEDFLNKSGTADWDNLDTSEYSEADWNAEFTFDIDLLDGSEYTDQAGRKYQFLPLNERGGKVAIIDIAGKTINAKFNITRKGELEIQLKKKSNNANGQPAGRAITDKIEGAKDGILAVTSVEPNNGIGDGAGPIPKALTLKFELIEVQESDTGAILKMKNIETKKAIKWTLTSFYNDIDDIWEDATEYFAEDIVDEDLANIDWDNLTEDDSDLEAILSDEDIENYDDTELNAEFEDAVDDAIDAVDDAIDAVDDAIDAVDDATDAVDDATDNTDNEEV